MLTYWRVRSALDPRDALLLNLTWGFETTSSFYPINGSFSDALRSLQVLRLRRTQMYASTEAGIQVFWKFLGPRFRRSDGGGASKETIKHSP
jgi:hypothetical protein